MQDKARRMCENAKLMIESAGSSMDKVVKVNVSRRSLFCHTIPDPAQASVFGRLAKQY